MNVLFWNVGGRDIASLVAEVSSDRSVDLLVLAEAGKISPAALLTTLKAVSGMTYLYQSSPAQSRIHVYTKSSHRSVRSIGDFGAVTVRSIAAPGCMPVTMVAVHSPSRMYWSHPADRVALARDIREILEEAEQSEGHVRSFVVGDFNSDPFEEALTAADGLHAVMCRKVAAGGSREVNKRDRKYLYNPMWSLLGDRDGVPGTYFYRSSVNTCRFWHSFDQVLLRPCMIDVLVHRSIEVVTHTGANALADKNGRPARHTASDHFPLFFSLDVLKAYPEGKGTNDGRK